MTHYVVFCAKQDGSLIHIGDTNATSATQAIRKMAARSDGGILHVAIPARSITRRKVTVETTTRVRVEPA